MSLRLTGHVRPGAPRRKSAAHDSFATRALPTGLTANHGARIKHAHLRTLYVVHCGRMSGAPIVALKAPLVYHTGGGWWAVRLPSLGRTRCRCPQRICRVGSPTGSRGRRRWAGLTNASNVLKKLWQDGLSASQIAKQLGGVTRNAVIGKVHRLGLSGRATPSKPAAHKWPSRPRVRRVRSPAPRRRRRSHQRRSAVSRARSRSPPVRYRRRSAGHGDRADPGRATCASGRSAIPSHRQLHLLRLGLRRGRPVLP